MQVEMAEGLWPAIVKLIDQMPANILAMSVDGVAMMHADIHAARIISTADEPTDDEPTDDRGLAS